MDSEDLKGDIKITDIFSKWTEYCKGKIDNDKLEFDCDGAYMTTSFDIEEVSEGWSSYKTLMVKFECEDDEDLKFEFCMKSWRGTEQSKYTSHHREITDLRSLKYLSDFEMLIMRISSGYENIIIDEMSGSEDTLVECQE